MCTPKHFPNVVFEIRGLLPDIPNLPPKISDLGSQFGDVLPDAANFLGYLVQVVPEVRVVRVSDLLFDLFEVFAVLLLICSDSLVSPCGDSCHEYRNQNPEGHHIIGGPFREGSQPLTSNLERADRLINQFVYGVLGLTDQWFIPGQPNPERG